MASWPHPKFEPQIRYVSASDSWRCLVRKLPDGEFKSLEAGQPATLALYPTPDAALAAAITRVTELLASRQEALAIEVVRLLTAIPARLKPQNVQDPETGTTQRFWVAQADNGTWTPPLPTPYEAVRVALNRVAD